MAKIVFDFDKLTGVQKASSILIGWGDDVSAEIMKRLPASDVEYLTQTISQITEITSGQINKVAEEFLKKAGEGAISSGDTEYLRKVLTKALGPKRAEELIKNMMIHEQEDHFEILKRLDLKTLVNFVKNEHPQTSAVIISKLEPNVAAEVLSNLKDEVREQIIVRIARLDKIPADVMVEIGQAIKQEFRDASFGSAKIGGIDNVSEILNQIDRSVQEEVLERLEESDPELAEAIRASMFTFEDLLYVDDRGMQELLRSVDRNDLTRAMKTASDELKGKIFRNMGKRASEMIREDLDTMGPVRLAEVENSQKSIVQATQRLAQEGKLTIAKGGGGDVLV